MSLISTKFRHDPLSRVWYFDCVQLISRSEKASKGENMSFPKVVALLSLLVMCLTLSAQSAEGSTIGTEDQTNGIVTDLFSGTSFAGHGYMVASDGEAAFDPYGVGDISDGLDFSAVTATWSQASDSSWSSAGTQKWFLPATTSCGSENEPLCEPIGHFVSPDAWSPLALGTYTILESDGTVSDIITLYNDSNGANVTFQSDPIPEPGTMSLLGLGVVSLLAFEFLFHRKEGSFTLLGGLGSFELFRES
jgi:hypothetical protein